MTGASDRRKREARGPIPEWELDYGMTLADVTRYRVGRPPADAMIVAKRQAEATRANGGTPTTSTRLHGTRLDVRGRALLLLTLAVPTGGHRMVAVDGATGAVREMWQAKVTRAAASRRHYVAVRAVCVRHGATVVQARGYLPPKPPTDDLPTIGNESGPRAHHYPRAGQAADCGAPWSPIVKVNGSRRPCGLCLAAQTGRRSLWLTLRMRLDHDGADDGYVGQTARYALTLLDSGNFGDVITELLDAARTAYAPLADAAGIWLRLLGYDQVHAHITDGPDVAYASQLMHYDHELATR